MEERDRGRKHKWRSINIKSIALSTHKPNEEIQIQIERSSIKSSQKIVKN